MNAGTKRSGVRLSRFDGSGMEAILENPIGIIGGMGPLSSQLFYKMITEHTQAQRDQDHVNLIILSDVMVPDRTKAILSGDHDAAYHRLEEDAKFLEKSGCQGICIICNTAHFFADRLQKELSIPLLNMVRETARAAAHRTNFGKIGIMATDGTVKTGLYQKTLEAAGMEAFAPPEDIQKLVMYQIYERIKKGLPYDAQRWQDIEEAYKAAGCGSVILGCTELSVIKVDEKLSDWYIDPMEILAEKVIRFAGKKYH